jgi:hypothetical protein
MGASPSPTPLTPSQSTPPTLDARRIVEENGVVLFEDDAGRLHFATPGGRWSTIPALMLGGFALLFLIQGSCEVLSMTPQADRLTGLATLALAAFLTFSAGAVVRLARLRRNRRLHELPVTFVLDIPGRVVRGAKNRVLAPLGELRFRREIGAFSTREYLVAEWAGGEIVVVPEGSFASYVDDIVRELEHRGFKVLTKSS